LNAGGKMGEDREVAVMKVVVEGCVESPLSLVSVERPVGGRIEDHKGVQTVRSQRLSNKICISKQEGSKSQKN